MYLINEKNQVVTEDGVVIWSCATRESATALADALTPADVRDAYGIQIRVPGLDCYGWHWVRPTNGNPYRFNSQVEAERAMRLCMDSTNTGYRVRKF